MILGLDPKNIHDHPLSIFTCIIHVKGFPLHHTIFGWQIDGIWRGCNICMEIEPWNCMPGYGNRSFTCWESIRSVVRGSSSRVWIKDSPKADMNDWAWLSTLKFGHFMHVTFPCIQFKAIQVVIYKLHGEREYSRESLENGNTFQQVIKDHDNGEKFMENVQQNQASIDGEGEGHHK